MKKPALLAGAFALAAVGVIVAPGATSAGKTKWFVDESALPLDPLEGYEDSTTQLWGVHAGSGYLIEYPDDWNGDLVLYTHGFRGDGLELTADPPPIRQHLLDEGYAWAASSYSANGYVPGVGARDTHKLIGLFRGKVAQPDDVFLTGFSMGGHVIGVAVEQWPNSFSGAVPMCGVMGDNELFDFFQDQYLLAEYFAGHDIAVPTPADYFTAPDGYQATFAELGPFFPVLLNERGEQYKRAIELLSGGERPGFDQGFADIFGVGGAFAFFFGVASTGDGRANADTVYQLDGDPALSDIEADLNAVIPRIDGASQFRRPNGLGRSPGTEAVSPRINGTMTVPVLSIHTTGELFVPFRMEQIYAERTAANGNSDLLAVRAIRDTGHCDFTLDEQIAAFDDMIDWVETGVKAAGDEILDPAVVAADDFGCQFTTATRDGIPACP